MPSECLVSLVREHRSKPLDGCAEVLLKTLMERVMAGLPKAESSDGQCESLRPSNMRDEGRYRFVKMLAMDRHEYLEALDFFEIRFQNALRKLRIDARRKICRKEDPLENIEADPVTGTIGEHVERAAGTFDPFEKNPMDDPGYRLRLDQAIDVLPDLQKAIVEMIRLGMPIESKEPGVVNISNTLGKTPKTIASHRDMAYASLSRALKNGEA